MSPGELGPTARSEQATKKSRQKLARACSLERYARHTQTVNLYAPLTLRFGLTHGRPCPQVWSGRRLLSPAVSEFRSVEQCRGSVRAVSGTCRGSVGAVSGQCRGSVG